MGPALGASPVSVAGVPSWRGVRSIVLGKKDVAGAGRPREYWRRGQASLFSRGSKPFFLGLY